MPSYHYENGVCEPHFEDCSARRLQALRVHLWTGGTPEDLEESASAGHILFGVLPASWLLTALSIHSVGIVRAEPHGAHGHLARPEPSVSAAARMLQGGW